MGLDFPNILWQVEDEFSINISHADAMEHLVLGDLHKYLVLRLRERGDAGDDSHVSERIQAIVAQQLGVEPILVAPQAHLIDDLGANR